MKIQTIESVSETEVRLTLKAESADEISQLRVIAVQPRLNGATPGECIASEE
jgi:hypothetical protein